jgi:hypothetical protein
MSVELRQSRPIYARIGLRQGYVSEGAARVRDRPRPLRRGLPQSLGLLEQLENDLAVLVGDGERLNAELLLRLQGLQARRGFVHVGVNE